MKVLFGVDDEPTLIDDVHLFEKLGKESWDYSHEVDWVIDEVSGLWADCHKVTFLDGYTAYVAVDELVAICYGEYQIVEESENESEEDD